MFSKEDYQNIIAIVNMAFEQGKADSRDKAASLLSLQNKAALRLQEEEAEELEEEDGDDSTPGR